MKTGLKNSRNSSTFASSSSPGAHRHIAFFAPDRVFELDADQFDGLVEYFHRAGFDIVQSVDVTTLHGRVTLHVFAAFGSTRELDAEEGLSIVQQAIAEAGL